MCTSSAGSRAGIFSRSCSAWPIGNLVVQAHLPSPRLMLNTVNGSVTLTTSVESVHRGLWVSVDPHTLLAKTATSPTASVISSTSLMLLASSPGKSCALTEDCGGAQPLEQSSPRITTLEQFMDETTSIENGTSLSSASCWNCKSWTLGSPARREPQPLLWH